MVLECEIVGVIDSLSAEVFECFMPESLISWALQVLGVWVCESFERVRT